MPLQLLEGGWVGLGFPEAEDVAHLGDRVFRVESWGELKVFSWLASNLSFMA